MIYVQESQFYKFNAIMTRSKIAALKIWKLSQYLFRCLSFTTLCNILGHQRHFLHWSWKGRQILLRGSNFGMILLRAVNLRHGTNGFISLPKEVILGIFTHWKLHRSWPGLNPAVESCIILLSFASFWIFPLRNIYLHDSNISHHTIT